MGKRDLNKLSDKERIVISEYLSNGMHQVNALKAAGYAHGYAEGTPHAIFGRQRVKDEIERRLRKMEEELELDEKWILRTLKKIAEAEIGALIELDERGQPYMNWAGLNDAQRASINQVEIDEYVEGTGEGATRVKKFKVRQLDRLQAIDKIMRHLGMFNDKLQVTGELSLAERLQRGRERMNQENAEQSEEEDSAEV